MKDQTSDFKNHDARNNWIKLFSQFYTFDAGINKKRPNKFTYPFDCKNNANQYEDNCNSNVYLNFSEEQYKIYRNIGKFVEGTLGKENIVKSADSVVKVSTEVFVDTNELESAKLLTDSTSDEYNPDVAVEVFLQSYWMDVVNDKKHPHNEEVTEIYNKIKEQVDERLLDEDDEQEVGEEGEEGVADVNDESELSGIGNSGGGTRALQGMDYGKKLALSPYMITPEGAKEGKINPDLPPLYGMNTPEVLLKSAINFVETSPKIYFCVKAIECTIQKHIENKEDISGQIIYMAWGQYFWYGGVRYNGMELIKVYLKNVLNLNNKFIVETTTELTSSGTRIKCGEVENLESDDKSGVKIKKYELEEVQILSGKSSDVFKKKAISDSFNNGKIKVLIGSGTIKEGINLQGSEKIAHGSSTIYVLTAEYAPMAMMQLEGRIWRQGNPLKNVRICNPLIKSSIDSHIYAKLNEKIKKVKNMLEAGIYDFKETQFEKDIEGISMELNTNIDEKIKIKWSVEEKKITAESKRFDSVKQRLEFIKKKYSESNSAINDLVLSYNAVSKGLEDYYVGKYIREDYKVLLANIKESIKAKKSELQDKLSKEYEKDLAEWQKLKDTNEKLNEANENKNKSNEKLIKEKKAKKIDKVDFNVEKPLKKDDKYQPDYTEIDLDEEQLIRDAKEKAVQISLKKVSDKTFTNDEITYHKPVSSATSYNEISMAVSKLLSEISVMQVKIMDRDEMRVRNSAITVTGYYFSLESKTEYIDYSFSKVLEDNSSVSPSLNQRMAKSIKDNNVQNQSGGMSLFKDFCKLFINGGAYENVLTDYQALVTPDGKTISDIDSLINNLDSNIVTNNKKLTEKEVFATKWNNIFRDEEEKIRKERESLTNMKQYVLVDVEKFCKTNKYIYIKGELTEKEEEQLFKIKK